MTNATITSIAKHMKYRCPVAPNNIKHPSPYPSGINQRIEVLKRVGTLRKQIDGLTFPTTGAQNTTSDENETINNVFAGINNNALNQRNV